ncbi:MAG: carboxypeptidase-like regulatory domain-containing protein [Bryobacteraceae bacterium]
MPSEMPPVHRRVRALSAAGLAALAAVVLFCAVAGFAKDPQTRTVQGAVSAPDDSLVNGAVVYLKNTKSLQIRSFFTQKDGSYFFHDLSPDIDYELKAEYNGLSSGSHTLSSFDSRKLATINLKLNPKK